MPEYPVSVKGVVLRGGRVALLRNERAEWELPGESPEQCLRREMREELGLRVEVGPLLHVWLYPVVPGREVFVVAYGCLDGGGRISHSDEHEQAGWFASRELSGIVLPEGYRKAVTCWLLSAGGEPGFGSPGRTPV